MPRRHLLIDADVATFQAAASCEVAIEWEPGYWTWHVEEARAKDYVLLLFEKFVQTLGADSYTLVLSDPKRNWRNEVLPTYKQHRKGIKRPLIVKHLREWLAEEHRAKIFPKLEGDDILGILATSPKFKGGHEKIIVTIDKDLRTIPGKFVNWGKDLDDSGEPEVVEISELDADNFFYAQALAGDPVDGYSGCPGIGMIRATDYVSNRTGIESYEHEFASGKRKGTIETRWREIECSTPWEAVVSHYVRAGLQETQALQQARVARILRYSEWDAKNKQVILWTPPEKD